MNDKPDILEKVIRFICGAILGVIFGFIYGIRFGSFNMFYLVLTLFVLGFGFLAMKFGDEFWKKIFNFPWT